VVGIAHGIARGIEGHAAVGVLTADSGEVDGYRFLNPSYRTDSPGAVTRAGDDAAIRIGDGIDLNQRRATRRMSSS